MTDLVLRPDIRLTRLLGAAPPLLLLVAGLDDDRAHTFTLACLAIGILSIGAMLVWRRFGIAMSLSEDVVTMRGLGTKTVPTGKIVRAVRVRTWSTKMWLLLDADGRALLSLDTGEWDVDALLDRLAIPREVEDRRSTFAEIGDRYPGTVPRWGRHPALLGTGIALAFFVVLVVVTTIVVF